MVLKLNQDEPFEGPGDYAEATKYYTPSPSVSHSIPVWGKTPVIALAIVLAHAIRFDELPEDLKPVAIVR